MTENWKPAPGLEGYEVSDLGNVRSYRPLNGRGSLVSEPRQVRPSKGSRGYAVITARCNGVRRQHLVHLLVKRAFCGDTPDGLEVAHEDGDRMNPSLANLTWKTRRDNHLDKKRHGTWQSGERHGCAKLTEEQAREILASQGPSRLVAERYGISGRTVREIRSRQSWGHLEYSR